MLTCVDKSHDRQLVLLECIDSSGWSLGEKWRQYCRHVRAGETFKSYAEFQTFCVNARFHTPPLVNNVKVGLTRKILTHIYVITEVGTVKSTENEHFLNEHICFSLGDIFHYNSPPLLVQGQ